MGEEEKSEGAPKKKFPLLPVVFGVMNLGAIGVALVVVLGGGKTQEAAAGEPTTAGEPKTGPTGSPGPVKKMDPFIVNIGTGESSRYLKAGIAVELMREDDVTIYEKSELLVRNEILMYLSSLTPEKVDTVAQKQAIEHQLKGLINKRVGASYVRGVYFTEFVTQ